MTVDRPDARSMLGSLEYRAMQVLWSDAPCSVDDVRVALNDAHADEWAYTTIMTVLSRLHDKELVDREQIGRAYQYTPRYDEEQLVSHLTRTDVQELVDRYGEVALVHFVSALDQASPDTRRRIERLARGDDDGG